MYLRVWVSWQKATESWLEQLTFGLRIHCSTDWATTVLVLVDLPQINCEIAASSPLFLESTKVTVSWIEQLTYGLWDHHSPPELRRQPSSLSVGKSYRELTRTTDLWIKSPTLSHLSYTVIKWMDRNWREQRMVTNMFSIPKKTCLWVESL